MIKVLYGEISEMETGYISLSIFLAMQHPSILSIFYMLFLILNSSTKSAPFLLGDYLNQISWSSFSRDNILWCEISLCNLFFILYHFRYFIIFLGVSVILLFAGCPLSFPHWAVLCQFISCHTKKKWGRSDNSRDKGKI